jgi:hypothetical protein
MRKIVTEYVYPPIPIRTCDWIAHFDDPEGLYAYGATKQEAVEELLELAEVEYHQCPGCSGKGTITGSVGNDPGPEKTVECESCRGAGTVEITDE